MSEGNAAAPGNAGLVEHMANDAATLRQALKEERRKRAELVKLLGANTLPEALERAKALATLETENKTLKQQLEEAAAMEPDEKDQLIADLWGELRTRDARSTFAKVATKAGLKPELHDDIYKLLGVELPEEGDITEDLFAEALEKNKAARPWAYAEPTSPPAGQSGTTLRPVGQSGELAVGNGTVKGPPGPGTVRGATEVTKPVSVADAIRAKFEATGRTDPYRIA